MCSMLLLLLQLGNKFLYGEVGFRDFLGPRAAALEVRGLYCDGKEVPLPPQGVEGICIVNIPSFAGRFCTGAASSVSFTPQFCCCCT